MALPSDSLYARGFAADAGTLRALREGLAGRKVKLQRGRLASAVRTLTSEPASRLLFIDLDGVKEPEAAGRQLAAVCAFETAVIAIGSTDTAGFARTLFQHGIADYLVKPVSPSLVREACATASEDLPERSYAGRVVAFSGTAGSGTSSLVAAIARAAADDGRTATAVDLDPVSGRLPGLLGAAPPDGLSALLAEIRPETAGEDETAIPAERIDRLCVQAEAGVSVIGHAAGASLPPAPSADAVHTLLGHLANRTHLVLVAGFSDPDMQLEIMQRADARVLVYEPTLVSLSAAVRRLALLGTGFPATLVQCFSRTARSSLSSAQVRYALGDRQPDVVIPFDTALHAAATGEKAKRPGRAYRQSVRKVMEHAIESAALSTAEAS